MSPESNDAGAALERRLAELEERVRVLDAENLALEQEVVKRGVKLSCANVALAAGPRSRSMRLASIAKRLCKTSPTTFERRSHPSGARRKTCSMGLRVRWVTMFASTSRSCETNRTASSMS